MPDSPVLALELLYDAVQKRFELEGPFGVSQPFGWRPPAQQHIGPRIVWIPGDPVGTMAGVIGPARNPGGAPRSIGTIDERFTCVISSQDPSDPENERLQYRCTRLLADYWYRAVYLFAHGTFEIEGEEWLIDKKERRFGTALRVVGTIEAMLPDLGPDGSDFEYAPADTEAAIDVTVLDNTETLAVQGIET